MDAPLPLAGRYRFVRQLRGTSSGVIWLASDSVAGRTVVASSVTSTRVAGLRKAIRLAHPHLASIVDMFDDISPAQIPGRMALRHGMAIAVAEHVSGQTLHEKLEAGALKPHLAVTFLLKLASALRALHAKGGVHGALSPRSIVISRSDGGTAPTLTNLRAAANGAYCSPERVRGSGPSAGDDVWALHATAYAALTGDTPYHGRTREELARTILSRNVPDIFRHGVDDEELRRIIQMGLDPLRERRLVAVEGFEHSLYSWLRSHPSVEQPRLSASPNAPFTVAPPAINDEEVTAGHLALARASAAQDGHLPGDDEDREDDTETVQRDSPDVAAARGFALGTNGHGPFGEQVNTSVMSAPLLDEMVDQIRASAEQERLQMSSDTRSMEVMIDYGVYEPEGDSTAQRPDECSSADPLSRSNQPEVVPGQLSGDQMDWGPSAQLPAAEGSAFPMDSSQLTAQDLADPAGTERASTKTAPHKRNSKLKLIFGGFAITFVAAALSFLVAVVIAGGAVPGPIASILGRGTPGPNASSHAAPTKGASAPSEPGEPTVSDAGPAAASGTAVQPGPLSEHELRVCVEAYFPHGTFIRAVPFEYICKNENPRKAAMMLHQQLVKGGAGRVTAGMTRWHLLGWYQLAAVAIIRDGCCPVAKPIELPDPGKPCPPMTQVLENVVRGGCSDKEIRKRATAFESSVICMHKHERLMPYRYRGIIRTHERVAFEEFLRQLPKKRCSR